jgi:predicted nucleic acid-binding protein
MILVDTNALVGAVNPEDTLHATALADLGVLRRYALYVTMPVLAEACYLLPNASERARLVTILTKFDVRPAPVPDDAPLRSEVLQWMLKYGEHMPDWADAHLAVLSARHPRWKVWTYDSEFWTTWRRPDGSRIPLAVRPSR